MIEWFLDFTCEAIKEGMTVKPETESSAEIYDNNGDFISYAHKHTDGICPIERDIEEEYLFDMDAEIDRLNKET